MAIDFSKPASIIVVHGVQGGDNKKIKTAQNIDKLVRKSLESAHIERDYQLVPFLYEDDNDQAQKLFSSITSAVTSGKPLVGRALKYLIDYAGDVFINAADTSTAHKIKQRLVDVIASSYAEERQTVVVSHSLGTVYSLDVVNDLMAADGMFMGDDRRTWPVQGLITLGSPLGLEMKLGPLTLFEKKQLNPVRDALYEVFPWVNFFNPLDPVVSGSVFGRPIKVKRGKGPLEKRYGADVDPLRWSLRGRAIRTRNQWLTAHSCYYNSGKVGDQVMQMLWG